MTSHPATSPPPKPAPDDILYRAWGHYCGVVSSDAWAIGYDVAQWVQQRCRDHAPERIADLGSGFSTWVLATGAPRDAVIHTVDTDRIWLGKTMQYIKGANPRSKPVEPMLWDEWLEHELGADRYDLIVFDLGGGKRHEQLPSVLDRLAPGGALVMDDTNRPHYAIAARQAAVQRGLVLEELPQPNDPYGRSAMVLTSRK